MNTDKFFVQLNLDFSDVDIDTLELSFSHGYNDKGGYEQVATMNFFNLAPSVKQELMLRWPHELQSLIKNVRIAVIKGQMIPPHIDYNGLVAVNYHIVSGNAKTTFWSKKDQVNPLVEEGENQPAVYHYDNIIKQCNYVANPGSCYLLNTGIIHDVNMEFTDSERKILQFTFESSMDYDTVLDKMLQLDLVKL